MRQLVVTSLLLIYLVQQCSCQETRSVDKVTCKDQQEACTCDSNADVCEFSLEIEELQTFTSYLLRGNTGELITRGTPGHTYSVGAFGYRASLNTSTCSGTNEPPECGSRSERRCWTSATFTTEEQFGMLNYPSGCSIPVTVDGRTYRLFIAVNGRIPGPTLIVTEDQIVQVNVVNQLTSEGVTIHWHGMHQRRTPWMDGVGSLSQIPIAPGGSFQYIFRAYPAGTHWYHSHFGAQRTDGLFGGLIVREKETEDVNRRLNSMLGTFEDLPAEHTLTLLDWQREASLSLFVQIHSTLGFYPNKPLGEVPTTGQSGDSTMWLYTPRTVSTDGIEVGPVPYWSGLINGRGRYDNNTYSVLSIFNVAKGKQYRFRLIGAQSLYAYRFEIVRHKLTVIATDGFLVQPRIVDYIIIHSGERYDFILDASQSINNYLIRATTLELSIWLQETRSSRLHTAEAVLHYEGALNPDMRSRYANVQIPFGSRCSVSSKCIALNCPFKSYPPSEYTDCVIIDKLEAMFPSDISDLPMLANITGADRLKFFNFGFEGQSSTSAINGRNFLPPPTPYQVYQGQYDDDTKDELVNTCGKCNNRTTLQTQPDQCTCIHVQKIVTNEDPESESDKSVIMVFSAVGNPERRLRDFAHPVHLHGHSFYVVEVGHGTYSPNNRLMNNSEEVVCESALCMNATWSLGEQPDSLSSKQDMDGRLINTAIRKDTVIVPAGGYVVVAFQADNPGYWFLHCHIEVHQLEGMAVIIQEYNEDKHNYRLPDNINKIGNFKWTVDNFIQISSAMRVSYKFSTLIMMMILGFVFALIN